MAGNGRSEWLKELGETLRLAGPIVAGNIGQILIGVVDTLMIGQLGVIELGAASFVNNLFIVPLVTFIGLLAAVPILVSQANGARDERQVGRYLKHALALTSVASVVVFGIMAANAALLNQYGQPPEVVSASRTYYWLIVGSLVPGLIYQCLKGVSEGLGWSNPPMYILLGGIGLNVVLNWILIFGQLGAPEMGLVGAGIATLIARCLIAAVMLAYLLKAARFRRFLPRSWRSGYTWAEIKSILRIGIPTAGQHLFEVGAFAGAGVMMGWLGANALASHQVAISCAAMAFMVPLGVSIACGIKVGEAFGGAAFRRLRVICFGSIGFTVVQTALMAMLFLVAGEWIAGWFVDDEAVRSLAASIFVVVGLFQIFDGTQVNCLGALRGLSDVNVPMLITFCAYWVVAIPAAYLLGVQAGYGAIGIWCGLAFGLAFSAVCLLVRLRLVLLRHR